MSKCDPILYYLTMDISKFVRDVNGWSGHIAWLEAEDPEVCEEALAVFDGPATATFRGASFTMPEMVNRLGGGLFGPSPTIVVIADIDKAKAETQEDLAKWISQIQGKIVLTSRSVDKRRKLWKAARKAKVWHVELKAPTGSSFRQWVGKRADKLGLSLDQNTTTFISRNLEGRLSDTHDLLEKLEILQDGSLKAAQSLWTELHHGTVFEMALLAAEGKAGKAIPILHQLMRTHDPLQICGTLAWALKRQCTASWMRHHRTPWKQIREELKIWHDEDRFRAVIDAAPPGAHLRRVDELWEVQASLKGGQATIEVGKTWKGAATKEEAPQGAQRKIWGLGLWMERKTAMERLLVRLGQIGRGERASS